MDLSPSCESCASLNFAGFFTLKFNLTLVRINSEQAVLDKILSQLRRTVPL